MGKNHKTWVEVSKTALKNNIEIVQRLLNKDTKLMAVVKSNAYGHGLVETAKPFSKYGVDWLGVDNIDEAILLRQSKIKKPILVLGFTPANRFREAVVHDLSLTVYTKEQLKYLLPGLAVHVKIDTGMSRQGVLVNQLGDFLKLMPRKTNLEGAFTHFANADDLQDRRYPNLQLHNFLHALKIFDDSYFKPRIIHASATTGLLTIPKAHFDMVRIGIALYGLWPSLEFAKKFKKLDLEPALSWKTRVVQIKSIKKGTPVGYGITERVKQDTRVAVLPVGYYDGYDRGLSSIGEVLISGKRCKILGRISMNLMVVDISKTRNTKIWDEVVLIGRQKGDQVTAEELASRIDTISYEIVSRINPLLPRIYV